MFLWLPKRRAVFEYFEASSSFLGLYVCFIHQIMYLGTQYISIYTYGSRFVDFCFGWKPAFTLNVQDSFIAIGAFSRWP